MPNITWLVRNRLVSSKQLLTEKDVINGDTTISFFDISNVTPNDEGSVVCIASNTAGTNRKTATLAVRSWLS